MRSRYKPLAAAILIAISCAALSSCGQRKDAVSSRGFRLSRLGLPTPNTESLEKAKNIMAGRAGFGNEEAKKRLCGLGDDTVYFAATLLENGSWQERIFALELLKELRKDPPTVRVFAEALNEKDPDIILSAAEGIIDSGELAEWSSEKARLEKFYGKGRARKFLPPIAGIPTEDHKKVKAALEALKNGKNKAIASKASYLLELADYRVKMAGWGRGKSRQKTGRPAEKPAGKPSPAPAARPVSAERCAPPAAKAISQHILVGDASSESGFAYRSSGDNKNVFVVEAEGARARCAYTDSAAIGWYQYTIPAKPNAPANVRIRYTGLENPGARTKFYLDINGNKTYMLTPDMDKNTWAERSVPATADGKGDIVIRIIDDLETETRGAYVSDIWVETRT